MIVDRAVGIDLGTTNSEVSLLVPSEREILVYHDKFGRKTVPSAVAWDPQKNAFVVGRAARARRGKEPPPIESIKRRMGQPGKVSCGPHELAPEEVSAKILAELKSNMEGFLGEKAGEGVAMRVTRAVITVPAYFDAPQVEATRKAGELAGLEVVGVLQEPTAAAIYQTWKNKVTGGNFLVYDLGGGTFDVSILRCVGGEYQVLAIDGDNYLGGDDFDRRYAEYLRKVLVKKGYSLELDMKGSAEDRRRFELLVHLAQEIKEALSTAEVLNFSKQDIFEDKDGESVSYEAEIARRDYDQVIGDLVETTIACAMRALEQSKKVASVGLEDIDHVILVGGSTRVPLVRRRVIEELASKSRFKEPLADDVDTCVALGASVHAAQIGGLRLEDGGHRVVFLSPLAFAKDSLRLRLRVESAPEGTREVAVEEEGTTLATAPMPTEKDEALRLDLIPVQAGDAAVSIVFRGADGATLGSIPFVVYRGEVRPRASALSRASVIAKDIAIEVVRAGRRDRHVLIPRGAGLPTESKHTFYTADQSGAVVLRLLQGRMPIKTLAVTVSRDLPVGSQVDLTIQCDEAMRVDARAIVAGQELWARVEAPEQLRFDQDGAVEQLLADADQVKRNLWGHPGDHFRREADALSSGIREVVSTDPAKLQALCSNLRRLVDEYQGDPADPLQPPLHHFEAELDGLRRVVYRSQGSLVGLDREGWEERIRELEDRAQAAHAAVDAPAWRRAFNEVQALYETAIQEEFATRKLDDPAYIQRRMMSLAAYRTRVDRSLSDFVPSSAEEVHRVQVGERDRLGNIMRDKVDGVLARLESGELSDPSDVRRQIEQSFAELERIEAGIERLPSLGLVTERGGGPSKP